jgi:hypothetical protein
MIRRTLALAALAAAIPASAQAAPRAVELSDASIAPTFLKYVHPGGTANVPCDPTDVSAYRWDGNALGAQRKSAGWDYWQARTGRAWYTDRVFLNLSKRPVIVAAWCD